MAKKRKAIATVWVKEDTRDILEEVKARTGKSKVRFVEEAVAEKFARMVKEPA